MIDSWCFCPTNKNVSPFDDVEGMGRSWIKKRDQKGASRIHVLCFCGMVGSAYNRLASQALYLHQKTVTHPASEAGPKAKPRSPRFTSCSVVCQQLSRASCGSSNSCPFPPTNSIGLCLSNDQSTGRAYVPCTSLIVCDTRPSRPPATLMFSDRICRRSRVPGRWKTLCFSSRET